MGQSLKDIAQEQVAHAIYEALRDGDGLLSVLEIRPIAQRYAEKIHTLYQTQVLNILGKELGE